MAKTPLRKRRSKQELKNDATKTARALYVQLSPATARYHRLLELAAEFGCSYHTIALTAIDWYLQTKTPTKKY